MFFNEPVDLGVDWSASYIGDHPILRFVSIDNLKRGLGDGSPTSVTQPSKSSFWPWSLVTFFFSRCWSIPLCSGASSTSSSLFQRRRSTSRPPWQSFSPTGQNLKSLRPWSGSTARWSFQLKQNQSYLKFFFVTLTHSPVEGGYILNNTPHTKRWSPNMCCQVHKSFPDSPGSVELSQSPPMLLGGTHFVVPVGDFTPWNTYKSKRI